jgi:hypothetical protein
MEPDREIDRLVYELYGLTEEEIKIVDPASRKATQGKEKNNQNVVLALQHKLNRQGQT